MLKKLLLTLFMLHASCFIFANAASVEAIVNSKEIIKGNSVQLRIKAVGGAATFPTIRKIDGIMVNSSGTSRESTMQITINGMKQERSTIKRYSFVPKHDMVIPAYTVRIGGKNYKTTPIPIKVRESQAPQVSQNSQFSFILKCDTSTVFAGESFVVTAYISASDQMKGAQIGDYSGPSSADFFVKEAGEQKKYRHNGFTTIEQQYIFTAKKEGNFTVAAASVKLGVPDRNRQDIFGRYATSWSRVNSNSLPIEVKALHTDAALIGDFNIETKIDAQKVKANKPVNLTIKIGGAGSLEDFEFEKYDIDGVTIYSDEAEIKSQLNGSSFSSSYSKNFAFIAENDFVIPAREIKVYNPKTQKTSILKVPEYKVEVKGTQIAAAPVVSVSPAPTIASSTTKVVEKQIVLKSIHWWISLFAFLLGMLVMYLLRFSPNLLKRREGIYKESRALKILYAHISEDQEVEEMVRKLYAKQNGDKSVQINKKALKEMVERFG